MTLETIQASILAFIAVGGFLILMRGLWRQFRGEHVSLRVALVHRLLQLLDNTAVKKANLATVSHNQALERPHPQLSQLSSRLQELGIKA